MSHLFTSESVCAGHPDKICDQISDAIVDAALAADPGARTGVETIAGNNRLILAGEVKINGHIDYETLAREQIRRLGYTNPDWGFSDSSKIEVLIHQQSPEIGVGVDQEGAGDQGMMFGFACRETPELMPLPIMLAHRLAQAVDEAREDRVLSYLRPDGKTQVVVKYDGHKPVSIEHVTVAVPHDEKLTNDELREAVYQKIIVPILGEYGFEVEKKNVVVNGTGVWHNPGPASDAGLTGRKIIVDGYGGYARVGGGAFSGKDPSKVDRSGAYAARFAAKNIVAAGLADKAEVSVSYYIGGQQPVMLNIETFGTHKKDEKHIYDFAHELIDFSVKGIIDKLDLRRPIYMQTAAYGHFGKAGLPWEQVV